MSYFFIKEKSFVVVFFFMRAVGSQLKNKTKPGLSSKIFHEFSKPLSLSYFLTSLGIKNFLKNYSILKSKNWWESDDFEVYSIAIQKFENNCFKTFKIISVELTL